MPDKRQWIDPNTTLQFEQRVLRPNTHAPIQNPDGTVSTHRMAWSDRGGKFLAYPTIIPGPDGKLVQLPDDLAFLQALDTGEYRSFNTPEDADAYASGGYKNSWGLGEQKGKK